MKVRRNFQQSIDEGKKTEAEAEKKVREWLSSFGVTDTQQLNYSDLLSLIDEVVSACHEYEVIKHGAEKIYQARKKESQELAQELKIRKKSPEYLGVEELKKKYKMARLKSFLAWLEVKR